MNKRIPKKQSVQKKSNNDWRPLSPLTIVILCMFVTAFLCGFYAGMLYTIHSVSDTATKIFSGTNATFVFDFNETMLVDYAVERVRADQESLER